MSSERSAWRRQNRGGATHESRESNGAEQQQEYTTTEHSTQNVTETDINSEENTGNIETDTTGNYPPTTPQSFTPVGAASGTTSGRSTPGSYHGARRYDPAPGSGDQSDAAGHEMPAAADTDVVTAPSPTDIQPASEPQGYVDETTGEYTLSRPPVSATVLLDNKRGLTEEAYHDQEPARQRQRIESEDIVVDEDPQGSQEGKMIMYNVKGLKTVDI